MGAICAFPSPIHEGKGKSQIFIDSKPGPIQASCDPDILVKIVNFDRSSGHMQMTFEAVTLLVRGFIAKIPCLDDSDVL